eukprot:6197622-Pleurochrysis_carterae.AAC.5
MMPKNARWRTGLAVGGSMSLARAAETSLAADGASKTQIVATSSVWAPAKQRRVAVLLLEANSRALSLVEHA